MCLFVCVRARASAGLRITSGIDGCKSGLVFGFGEMNGPLLRALVWLLAVLCGLRARMLYGRGVEVGELMLSGHYCDSPGLYTARSGVGLVDGCAAFFADGYMSVFFRLG